MRGGMVLILLLLAGVRPAEAASFPCAKASTPTEKAICADPGLSRLDERMAAAYRAGLESLSEDGVEEGTAVAAVKADQRVGLGERNACGADAGCLRGAMERRLAVLSFNPDPAATPGPADRFVGRFDHGGFMHIAAMALRDGRLAVSVGGAEPTAGRWLCGFSGIGRLEGGRLVVGAPGPEGDGLVLEAKGTSGVAIPDNEANRAAAATWCGHNGRFAFAYSRRR